GGMPLEEVQKHAAAEGYSFGIESRDTQTIERHNIADHLAPHAPDPASIKIDYASKGRAASIEVRHPGGLEHFDAAARVWCSKLDLAPEIGADLIERSIDFAVASENLTPQAREQRDLQNQPVFERLAAKRGISVEQLQRSEER